MARGPQSKQHGRAQSAARHRTGDSRHREPQAPQQRTTPAGRDRNAASEAASPPAIGSVHTVTADRLNDDGDGVGRIDAITVFVPDLLPGEEARVRVTANERRFLRAAVIERLTDAESRLAPACAVFGDCGGCQLQHFTHAAQLEHKRRVVEQALVRIAKLPDVRVHPTLGMDEPWRYRNQVQVPLEYVTGTGSARGRLVTGFFASGSHRIVHSATCDLEPAEMEQAVAAAVDVLSDTLGARALAVHHLIARRSHTTGDIMLVIAVRDADLDLQAVAVKLLSLPNVVSVARTVQPQPNGPVWGRSVDILAGSAVLTERLVDVEYLISPRSFFQVNTAQAERLIATALSYADVGPEDTVLDAYCGTGSISLPLARRSRQVVGIESVPEAVADARRNAEHNAIANARFEVGQVESVLPTLLQEGLTLDVAVVDPPRKGCDRVVLDALLDAKPQRVVYVSCNHATLARDLRVLVDGGYSVIEAQPVDMFPQTSHVEVVCLLVRDRTDAIR